MLSTITAFAKVPLPLGVLLVAAGLIGAPQNPIPSPQTAISTYDTDQDGTIDENEAKAAAGATFDKLDADNDGTLDARELQAPSGRVLLRLL